jgi:hypothetical protein
VDISFFQSTILNDYLDSNINVYLGPVILINLKAKMFSELYLSFFLKQIENQEDENSHSFELSLRFVKCKAFEVLVQIFIIELPPSFFSSQLINTTINQKLKLT